MPVLARMNLYSIASIAAVFSCYLIAAYSHLKDTKSFLNRIFAIQAICIGTWCLFPFLTIMSPTPEEALLKIKIIYVAAAFTPSTGMHFIFELIRLKKGDKRYKYLYLSYAASVLFAGLAFTPFYLKDVFYVERHFAIQPDFFFCTFILFFGLALLYPYHELFLAYRSASGYFKNQYKYVLMAYIIAFIGGLIHFMPSFIRIPEPLPHDVLIVAYMAIIVYVIVKHRLMDIGIVVREAAVHVVSALAVGALFISIGLYFFSKTVFVYFLLLAALLSSIIYEPVKRLLRPILYGAKFEYQKAIGAYSKQLLSILDIGELVRKTIDAIVPAMRLKQGFILLQDNESQTYRVVTDYGFDDDISNIVRVGFDSPLVRLVQNKQEIIIRDDLKEAVFPDAKEALNILTELHTTVCVPVIIKDKLLGLINLGEKLTGEIYYAEDLNLLSTLANQFAIAVENARAYAELDEYKSHLEDKVEEKTKELQEAQGQLIHSAKLASVGQLAAGVAHEINNPVSFVDNWLEAIRMDLTDIKENKLAFADSYPELMTMVNKAGGSLNRIKRIVQALLSFSRKNQEGMSPINIYQGLDSTLDLLANRIRHDEITIEKSLEKIDAVQADLQHLNQVFFNLISNAMDSIIEARKNGKPDAGCIRISGRQDDKHIILSFKDDGMGIPEDIRDKIFDPFFTTKEVGKGTGLGLNISYRIMQNHEGMIEVKSAVNEGAEFIIKLPRIKKG